MATLNDISSQWWSFATSGPNAVVQDAADINQCISIILMTVPGSDPFRPSFGSRAFDYVDQPVNTAIPNISREIIESLERWEPRISIEDVVGSLDEDLRTLVFEIKWKLLVGDLTEDVTISFSSGLSGQTNSITPIANFIQPQTQAAIKALNWQFSTEGFGQVAQGVDDISQSILLILSTIKGSDPFRPLFGSDIWDYIDQPLFTAAPSIVSAITDAVNTWEPRIILSSISYVFINHDIEQAEPYVGIKFSIGWKFAAGEVSGDTDVIFGFINVPGNEIPISTDPVIFVLSTEAGEPLLTEEGNYIEP
jgi:phage baseplate assembly protein W